jgi:undecaprenyl-diphosphatase
MFEIIIQLGTILAVVFYYRKRILESLRNIKPGQWGFRLWFLMFIAFLPSAALGLIFNDEIEKYLFSPFTVSLALIFGAILMIVVENKFVHTKNEDILEVDAKKSLLIGCAQCMSLFPGMSRSSSTIIGGMMVGLTVKTAAEFSFFLAIPTMFAATGYSLLKGFMAMTTLEWIALAVGFIVSFIVAFFVVGKFLSFLGNHSLKVFAYYRLLVGFLMLLIIGLQIY